MKDCSADDAESSLSCSQVRTELSESSDTALPGVPGLLEVGAKKASRLGSVAKVSSKGRAVPPFDRQR